MASNSDEPPVKRRAKTSAVKTTPKPGTPTFGAVLRRFRQARGLTREDLFLKSGLTVEAIGALERGARHRPRRATVDLLASALALLPFERISLEAAAGYRQEQEPLIGRESEWAWFQREITGQRPLIVIAGEPGLGKSSLQEAMSAWASGHGWHVVTGGCHRYSGQEAYAPITEAIKESIRALLTERQSADLKAHLNGCARLAHLLPELLDEGVLEAPSQTLPADQERRLMFDAVACYLQNVGGETGTLLVLDDMQWAATDTIQLLTHLLRVARPGHIRILAAYRSNAVAPSHPLAALEADLARDDLVAHLDLARLTPEATTRVAADLVRSVLEDVYLTSQRSLVQRLTERAEGVPIFIVHLVRALRDLAREREAEAERDLTEHEVAAGAQANGGTAKSWISAADVDQIPRTIAQYVRQQVDSLPPDARALVEVAAVAVQARSGAVLAECIGHSESELLPDLEAAYRSGLLVTDLDSAGRVIYSFAHELLREAVDGELSAQRRMMLHRALGAALERGLGIPLDGHSRHREDLVPWLAYHCARSGEPERAATYLRLAGDQARRMYAHEQAASYYAKLATLLDELRRDREAADARRDLADEFAQIGRFAEVLEVLARAGDTYRMLDDVESLALVTADIAATHATRGTVSAGLAELLPIVERIATERPAAQAAADALSPAVRAWLLATLSYLSFMVGKYEDAVRTGEQALDVAQTTGEVRLVGQARCSFGIGLFSVGRATEASEVLRHAISSLEESESDPTNRRLLVELQLMAIWVAQTQGEFARCHTLQEQALAGAQELGNPAMIGHASIFEGLLAFYEGNWIRAWQLAKGSATAFDALDGLQLGSYPPLGLGILCLICGRRKEAMRHLEDARAIALCSDGDQVMRLIEALLAEDELVRGHGAEARTRLVAVLTASPLQERTRIELHTLLAWAVLQTGHVIEAEEIAVSAVASARVAEMRLLMPDALRVRALCAIARRDFVLASDALAEALVLCKQMPYPYAEAKVRYVYGQFCLAMDKTDQAREQFEQALAICSRVDERMYGALIEEALEPLRRERSAG